MKNKSKAQYLISMPLCVKWGLRKPKNIYFNLNNYRNWHYQLSNNLKKWYKETAQSALRRACVTPCTGIICLEYVLWKRNKGKVDRSNVLSVHEKFFCDAFTELGYIPDDNDDYIESSYFTTGGIDRDNPRVDILIKEYLC